MIQFRYSRDRISADMYKASFSDFDCEIQDQRRKIIIDYYRRNKKMKRMWVFRTLRFKMIAAFLVPIVFIILLGVVSFQKAATGIRGSYEETAGKVISMTGEYLRFGIGSIENSSVEYMNNQEITKYFSGQYKNDKFEANSVMKSIKSSILAKSTADEFVANIYLLSDSVTSIVSMDSVTDSQTDKIYRGFTETEAGKYLEDNRIKVLWLGKENYLDDRLGVNTSDYALRLIRKLQGSDTILVMDVRTETVEGILKNTGFDQSGFLSFVTEDGKEITAEGTGEAFFQTKDFYKEALKSDQTSGSVYVKYNNIDYLFMFSKIENTNSMVCALVLKSVITGKADPIRRVTFLIVIIACVVAVLIGLWISLGIDRTIKGVIVGLKKAAKGDLTIEFRTKRKDEFRILIEEIQNTFINMKQLIRQVKQLSNEVSESSYGVKDTSSGFLKATEEISIAMKEIDQGMMQQADDAGECLTQMDSLSKKIVQVGENTREISQIAEDTRESVRVGNCSTEVLKQQTRETIEITTNIIHAVERLSEKSMSVSRITNTISEIANQTNLLSLNASIEAARAGEFGRGFGVVADEIGKLANQSNQSVQDIKVIISSITEDTFAAVETARKVEGVLNLQEDAVNHTSASYDRIDDGVEKLVLYLKQITENVYNMGETKDNTLGAIENISAVLEETAASSNTVNHTADDQKSRVEELNQAAGTLSDNAQMLKTAIAKFVI
jgi:methyl-accepting chemotaxis protein